MDRLFANRRFSPLFLLFMSLVTLGVYSNSFFAAFQYDDVPIVRDNFLIRDLGNLGVMLENTRAVTLVTFALNYAVGGLDTTGYHVVNFAIHIINAALAYILLLATFKFLKVDQTTSRRISAFAALLFAVHPIQTQAVTYIVQRMESLSSMFYLIAILLFIMASQASNIIKRGALYGGVALSYVLAFYSKEITYTLPAAILLYDYFFIAKGQIKGVLKKWPAYALLAVLFGYFTYATVVPLGGFNDLSDETAAVETDKKYAAPIVKSELAPAGPAELDYTAGFKISQVSPKEYLYTQFNVMVYYLGLLLVPANQNLDYDFPWAKELFKAPAVPPGTVLNMPMLPPIVSLLVLLIIIGAAVYLFARTWKDPHSKARAASYFIIWFFLVLSPTSSFVPIVDAIYEHRVYLASLGYFTVFVMVVDAVIGRIITGKKAPKLTN